ncbi:MAG: retropepsin-like domain-containing protein, partial [Deltaproteobacteria bacterium]|nr:retropepsin-like domain-containing protein [Deltaproteobacteria bacterium]
MMRLYLLLCVGLSLSSCGDDPLPFFFEGETGTPHEIALLAGVPAVEGRALSSGLIAEGPLLLDTGAPVSLLDIDDLSAQSPGWYIAEFEALGLRFLEVNTAVFNLFDESSCAVARPVGIIGGDLLGHFTVDLDYRAQQITLHQQDDAPGLITVDAETPVSLPLKVLGGGRAAISGLEGVRTLAATRALLEVEVEGTTRWAMIDTGASLSVVRPNVVETDAQTRPRACCFSVTTIEGEQRMPLARLRQLSLGSTSTLPDVAVLVGDVTLFELLSAEVGREIDLILGANVLARYGLRLEPRAGALQ